MTTELEDMHNKIQSKITYFTETIQRYGCNVNIEDDCLVITKNIYMHDKIKQLKFRETLDIAVNINPIDYLINRGMI